MLTKTNARLKHFSDRLIRLEDERKALTADIKGIFDEAKSEGFTVSALRKAIRIRSLDAAKREKHDAEQTDLEIYLAQLDGKESWE